MDQRLSMIDSVTGGLHPALQVLLLFQIGLELEAEIRYQNQFVRQESKMREIRDLAAGMKGMVTALRKDAAQAKDAFHSEFTRAQVNTDKFKAFTKELNEANSEVESFLGETGSNFPTSEDSVTPPVNVDRNGVPFINGVTLNRDVK